MSAASQKRVEDHLRRAARFREMAERYTDMAHQYEAKAETEERLAVELEA